MLCNLTISQQHLNSPASVFSFPPDFKSFCQILSHIKERLMFGVRLKICRHCFLTDAVFAGMKQIWLLFPKTLFFCAFLCIITCQLNIYKFIIKNKFRRICRLLQREGSELLPVSDLTSCDRTLKRLAVSRLFVDELTFECLHLCFYLEVNKDSADVKTCLLARVVSITLLCVCVCVAVSSGVCSTRVK